MKILACQIIGPAATGSAGPVPTPLSQCKLVSGWGNGDQRRSMHGRPCGSERLYTYILAQWHCSRTGVWSSCIKHDSPD